MATRKISTLSVWGLVSSEKDYRISYFLNKELSLNLQKAQKAFIIGVKNQEYEVFYHYDRNAGKNYLIVENGSWGKILFPAFKKFTYWFIVSGSLDDEFIKSIDSSLGHIRIILLTLRITDGNILPFFSDLASESREK